MHRWNCIDKTVLQGSRQRQMRSDSARACGRNRAKADATPNTCLLPAKEAYQPIYWRCSKITRPTPRDQMGLPPPWRLSNLVDDNGGTILICRAIRYFRPPTSRPWLPSSRRSPSGDLCRWHFTMYFVSDRADQIAGSGKALTRRFPLRGSRSHPGPWDAESGAHVFVPERIQR